MLVREIMTRDVITVRPETAIRELAELLVEKRISGVPVVDDGGTLRGIVSEGDLMRKEIAPDLPDDPRCRAAPPRFLRRAGPLCPRP